MWNLNTKPNKASTHAPTWILLPSSFTTGTPFIPSLLFRAIKTKQTTIRKQSWVLPGQGTSQMSVWDQMLTHGARRWKCSLCDDWLGVTSITVMLSSCSMWGRLRRSAKNEPSGKKHRGDGVLGRQLRECCILSSNPHRVLQWAAVITPACPMGPLPFPYCDLLRGVHLPYNILLETRCFFVRIAQPQPWVTSRGLTPHFPWVTLLFPEGKKF